MVCSNKQCFMLNVVHQFPCDVLILYHSNHIADLKCFNAVLSWVFLYIFARKVYEYRTYILNGILYSPLSVSRKTVYGIHSIFLR